MERRSHQKTNPLRGPEEASVLEHLRDALCVALSTSRPATFLVSALRTCHTVEELFVLSSAA